MWVRNGLCRFVFRGARRSLACVYLGDGIADLDFGPHSCDVRYFSEEEAQATKELAFNQGFYNLFLAIVTVTGIVIGGTGRYGVGLALIFAGTGSMLAAAVVLLASSPDKARAASTQGIFPLIAIVLFIVGLAM